MKYFFVRFKKQLLRLLAAVLVFGAALLVLLYFLGYYDFSFLDRYKYLGEIFNDAPISQNGPSSLFDPSVLMGDDAPGMSETEAAETLSPDGSQDSISMLPEDYVYYETKSVKRVFEAEKLPDKLLTTSNTGSRTVASLLEDGYTGVGISYSEAGLTFAPPVTEEPAEPVEGEETSEEPEEDTGAADVIYVPEVVTGEFVPGETTLGKLTFAFQLPDTYSLRKRRGESEVVRRPSDDGEWYVETVAAREERPAVELYMGYILIDNGRELSLIASDATPLSAIDERVYYPAYIRDRYDRPLFYRKSAEGEIMYFYMDTDGKNFVSTEYDEVAEGRGLRFDYPASYGKSDSGVTTDKNGVNGRMAYVMRGVGMLTTYDFTRAYGYSEGYAAVTTTKSRNGLYFLDANGQRAFDTWEYYFNEHGRDVYGNLMPPLTKGIEQIGSYYFDHGLVRVRRQVIDAYNWAYVGRVRTVLEEDLLIRPDGSVYELPAGYELKGYSDGRILLSKNGKYGFIDYTGEWIAQPIFADATPFVCGLATLTTEDGRVGMIDTEGNIVLQFTYDYISQVSDGLIATYRKENGWTVLKMMQAPETKDKPQ